MNTTAIRKWGEKLRDCHFHTCQNTLSAGPMTFCAEGALCKLMGIGEWVPYSQWFDLMYDGRKYQHDAPEVMWEILFGTEKFDFQDWQDFCDALAHVYREDYPDARNLHEVSVVYLNDTCKLSVQKIGEYLVRAADYLDSQALGAEAEAFLRQTRVADYAI